MTEGQDEADTDLTPLREGEGDMTITLTMTSTIIQEGEDIVEETIVTMMILIMIGEEGEPAEFPQEEGEIPHHVIEEGVAHH